MTEQEWRAVAADLKTKIAVLEERLAAFQSLMQERFDGIEANQKDSKTAMQWVVRTILGALLVAAVGFAVSGGFVPK